MKLIPLAVSWIIFASHSAFAIEEDTTPKPNSILSGTVENVRATASELIIHAMGLLGVNYQYGGNTPSTGFDCSGFVSHVFREAAGVALPHSAYQMSLVGQKISNKELQPGDLVFYNTLKRAFSHVGIYVGNNQFIHSPSPGKAVEIVDMKDRYWLNRYQGARRVPQLDQPAAPSAQTIQKELKDADLSTLLH
ncbi:MAG: C40 family peptidase [Pseudomonadota bacterium]